MSEKPSYLDLIRPLDQWLAMNVGSYEANQCYAIINRMIEEVSPDWRPISSAPKDGVMKLFTNGTVVFVGCWVDWNDKMKGWAQYRCVTGRGYNTALPADRWPLSVDPTHWMPLPPPPTGEEK